MTCFRSGALLACKGLFKFCMVIVIAVGYTQTVQSETTINVGGYVFPPFLDIQNQQYTGILIDTIQAFNKSQTQYKFKFTSTSSKRRYHDLSSGRFDVIMFESEKWGWDSQPVHASSTLLTNSEIYIAKRQQQRSQQFFESIQDRKLVAVLGYHYRFANYMSNADYLNELFNIRLVSSMETVINQIIHGQADIGVVTYTYLKYFYKQHPLIEPQILIGDVVDHQYEQKAILAKNRNITLDQLNEIISKVQQSGRFNEILLEHGIASPHTRSPLTK